MQVDFRIVLVGAVVIVTNDCSHRPSAPCGRVAMAMPGCSVGVLYVRLLFTHC